MKKKIFAAALILLTAALATALGSEIQSYEEAGKIIAQASTLAVKARYDHYETYFKQIKRQIARKLDEGATVEDAVNSVRGITPNERIEAVINYFRDQGLEADIRHAYEKYRNVIEPIFETHGLNSSIYGLIPWRESQFEPRACTVARVNGGHMSVKGMWQLLESTADELDLQTTSTECIEGMAEPRDVSEDERFNVEKSTEAAARHLTGIVKELGEYGSDPVLVLTAYHMGVSAVKKMIDAYGSDFWSWKDTDENRRNYGFGPKSYDYAPWVLASATILEQE